MASLHTCVPGALATLASALHGGSLILLDNGAAEAVAAAAGIKMLTGQQHINATISIYTSNIAINVTNQ